MTSGAEAVSLEPAAAGPVGHGRPASRPAAWAGLRRHPRRDPGDVYRELAPAVLGYLRGAAAPDPEDLLGEVFLQVVRDLGRFRGDDEALRRWVFTIAYHRLIDARRRAARRPRVADASLPEPAAPAPAEALDPALAAALAGLTPEQRDVVVLRFVADLPVRTVARLTRRTPGAVKALQHRALQALSQALAGHQLAGG